MIAVGSGVAVGTVGMSSHTQLTSQWPFEAGGAGGGRGGLTCCVVWPAGWPDASCSGASGGDGGCSAIAPKPNRPREILAWRRWRCMKIRKQIAKKDMEKIIAMIEIYADQS